MSEPFPTKVYYFLWMLTYGVLLFCSIAGAVVWADQQDSYLYIVIIGTVSHVVFDALMFPLGVPYWFGEFGSVLMFVVLLPNALIVGFLIRWIKRRWYSP